MSNREAMKRIFWHSDTIMYDRYYTRHKWCRIVPPFSSNFFSI